MSKRGSKGELVTWARGRRGRYFRKDRIPGVIKQGNYETVGEVEEVLDVKFLIFSIM